MCAQTAGNTPAVAASTPIAEAAPAKRHLRVAVAGSKPFVVRAPNAVRGLSIDVWKAVAEKLGVGFEPYYTASAGILAQSVPASAWQRFKPLLSRVFLVGFAIMVIVLFVVGNLVWLAERRVNAEQFPARYGPGVLAGMWFAMVTMTTVGYGDKAPRSAGGKAVASVWMLIALLAMSSVTAGIATAFTLSQIQTAGISDMSSLSKRKVVVVDGTPGQSLAQRYGANVIAVSSKQVALDRMRDGAAEAMVYDYPVLQYYLHENPELKLVAIPTTILSDNYGFAVKRKSPLVAEMNIALLHLRESGKVRELAARWRVGK